jgi:hypothetical protein
MSARDYERKALTELKEIVTGDESKLSEVKDFLAVFRLLKRRVAVEHSSSVDTLTRISESLP